MKRLIYIVVGSLLLQACGKAREAPPAPEQEARYRVTLQLSWSNPHFSLPATNAHFTTFVGAVHSADTFLWKPGSLSTPGVEFVAEVGSSGRLNNEIEGIIARGKAASRFAIPPPAVTGVTDTVFILSLQHPSISFLSMIAPSPDWFVGLNTYSPLQNNQWLDEVAIPLYLYDAGTEEGDVFGYDNPATQPHQLIKLLTPANALVLANGNSSLAAIGSIRLKRL